MASFLEVYDLNIQRLCILNDNSTNSAKNIKVEKKINSIDKLTFALPLSSDKWKYLINDNLIKWEGQFYFIRLPKYSHSTDEKTVTVDCPHLSSSLQRKLCPEITEEDGIGRTALELLQIVLTDTNWFVGTIDSTIIENRDLITSEQSAFSNLIKIAEKFSAFLEFDSSTMEVSLFRTKIDRNIQIRKGKNLKSVDIEYDTNDMATRLFAFGGDDLDTGEEITIMGATVVDDDGNIVYKKDSNGNYILNSSGEKIAEILETSYIEDYSYYTMQGYDLVYIEQHPELFLSESTWNATEYYDTQLLYVDAKKKLKTLCKPKVTCSVEGVDLSIFPQYFVERPEIGELVHIFDEDLNLSLTAQVISITKNYDNLLDLKIEISNEIAYSSVLQQLVETSNNSRRNSNANGTIRSSYIKGVIDVLKTKLNSTTSKWHTDAQGNIVFESLDGNSCMLLGGGIFGIANSKDVDGSWNFKTFGTGEGFTADQIVLGMLKGGDVQWNVDDMPRDIFDENGVKLYTLPSGALLIGNSLTDYKLYYDGTNLNFGVGSITWENLDDTAKEGLSPSIYTLSIIGGVRNFAFDVNGDNQTTPTAYSIEVRKNNVVMDTSPAPSWSYGGFLSGSTSTPVVGKYTTTDTYVKATVVIDGISYSERIPISGSKVGATGTSGSSGNSTVILYRRYYKKPPTPTGNAPLDWYSKASDDTTKFGYTWFVQGIKNSSGTLLGTWSEPFALDEVDTNILWDKTWTIGTGTDGVYTANETVTGENKRELGTTPFGSRDIIWRGIAGDTANPTNGDGGWNVLGIPIDDTKQYRVSVFVKQFKTSGSVYFGCSTTSTNNLDGSSTTTPYFYNGDMPEVSKWYLLVGYINSSADTSTVSNASGGIYDVSTGYKISDVAYNFLTFKNKSGATSQTHSVYQSYTNDKGAECQFYLPRFDVVDGNEPSLNDILRTGLQGNFVDYKYKRSTTQPTTPTNTEISPVGWFDNPPIGTDKLWMIKATKNGINNILGNWSTPIQINGDNGSNGSNGDYYIFSYSADGTTNWHDTFVDGDKYIRQKLSLATTWGIAIKIVGEDGETGEDGGYVDYRFMRNATTPSTPTGNIPANWSDVPPLGTDKLWMIKGSKNADGVLQGVWSTPVQISGDKGSTGDTYSLLVNNGVRSITYDASGGNPNPSISAVISCVLYRNGVVVPTTDYTCLWETSGHVSGTASTSTFTPLIDTAYNGDDNNNYIKLTVDHNGNKISSQLSISVTRDASGVDWVNDWTTGATTINDKRVISPRIFAGTNTGTETSPNLTGVAIGKDVMDGHEDLIGIVAYKNNNATFQLDVNGNVTIGMAGKKQIYLDGEGNAVIPRIVANDIDSTVGKSLDISQNSSVTAKANKSYVDDVNKKADDATSNVNKVYTYFDFASNGMTIGKTGSPQQITIDNISMQFIDSGTVKLEISTNTISGTGTIATASFTAQTVAPYSVGSYIEITGAVPTGYNGVFKVTACTTTSVSWLSATTGNATTQGKIKSKFVPDSRAVAYINGQKMSIGSLEVLNSVLVGVHKIEKYNDSITLIKWVGASNG